MEERDIIFKVGTKVKLRDYLKVGSYYGGVKFGDFCKQDFGKVLTITKVTPCNGYISTTKYEFEETPLEYTVEMLEPIKEKTMKYKAGDKVRIRKDLKADVQYGSKRFTNSMCKYRGKETTITKVLSNFYTLKVDDEMWSWSEEMLEPVTECDFNIGDKVIFNPAEKDKLTGVFTVSKIDMDLNMPYIKLKEVKECMWFNPNRFLKAPRFKIGDKVVIRDDLVPRKYKEWDYSPEDGLGGWEFAAAMAKYIGKVATITGYVGCDPNYCYLDIDKGTYSWIVNSLLPYTPGSDYDLDKQSFRQINKYFPTNKQQTKQNYENRLQEKGPVIAGRERQSGCAVRYPGEQIRVGISNLGYRKITCKRQEGS